MTLTMKTQIPMLKYSCPKCGSKEYTVSEIRVSGSVFSQLSNFGHRTFTTVTCGRCSYTDLYRLPMKRIGEAFSFQTGK